MALRIKILIPRVFSFVDVFIFLRKILRKEHSFPLFFKQNLFLFNKLLGTKDYINNIISTNTIQAF